MEKLEWCGYQTVKKIEDMITRFDRIHERDGQIDTASHDGTGRACIASRGKNEWTDFDENWHKSSTWHGHETIHFHEVKDQRHTRPYIDLEAEILLPRL